MLMNLKLDNSFCSKGHTKLDELVLLQNQYKAFYHVVISVSILHLNL